VNGIGGTAGEPWKITITGGTESVLDNVANVDYEVRHRRGRPDVDQPLGTNDGNPPSRGVERPRRLRRDDERHRLGHVHGPWTAYRAQPDGRNWVAL